MPTSSAFFRGITALALFGASMTPAAVGDWTSYSDFGIPTAFINWHDRLFVGTAGGVRQIDPRPPFHEVDYSIGKGLSDVDIVAFARDPDDRLWAGSRSGQLFRLEGDRWSAWGKSYASAGWTLSPRALAASGRYLILGTIQGLSLFDRISGRAEVNLTKFGSVVRQPVTGLMPSGDTLYIVAGGSVMYARIDWSNAASDKFGGTVFDPAIWRRATNFKALPDWARDDETETGPAAGGSEADSSDSTGSDEPIDYYATDTVEISRLGGNLVVHGAGVLLDSPVPIKALKGRQCFVDGGTYGNLNTMETAIKSGDQIFLGGTQGLWFWHDGNFGFLQPPGPLPSAVDKGLAGRVIAVAARGGSATLLSGVGLFGFGKGESEPLVEYPASIEVSALELRFVTALPQGGAVFGSWGRGLSRHLPGGKTLRWSSANSCLFPVLSNDYTVVRTLSDAFGNDIWLTLLQNTAATNRSLMAHLDLATNTVSCPEIAGDNYQTYSTRILTDTLFAVAGDKTMRIYRFGIGGVKSNIEPFGLVTGGSGTDEGRDMQMDGYGRLWALMNGRIGYVDSLGDKIGIADGKEKKLPLTFLENFSGENCTVLERDARDGLWAGCQNGITFLAPGKDPALTKTQFYDRNDGLLSNHVIDLSVDPLTGKVWAVTENGISVFQSAAQPPPGGVSGIRAYPNPFRARHRVLVIDNVPPGATGAILTQSGDAVRRFESADLLGNQFQWDGTNSAGRKVTPGVYFYSVSADGKTSRGKIIVGR